MIYRSTQTRVYLALGNTDMRKAINGLSMFVQGGMNLDPFSGHLFVFCNRRCTILKVLYWDRNGFCLYADLRIKAVMLSPKLCRVNTTRARREVAKS